MIKLLRIENYSLFIISMTLLGIAMSLTGPFLSLYCTEVLGMSTGAFGLFMATLSLCGVIVNSLIASRSDKGMDRKIIIMVATMSYAMGYGSYLVFHNYYVLLVVVALFIGIGSPAMSQIFASARESLIESESQDTTFANSLLRSLFSLGFLIGPLVGTVLLTNVGYKGVFSGTSIIFLIITVSVFLFLKPMPKKIGAMSISQDKSPLRQKQVLVPFIALIILFICHSTNYINTALFIVHTLNGTKADVGIVTSLCAGLEVPIMIGLGLLSARVSSRSLMISGCLVGLSYYAVMLVSTQVWQIVAAQLLQATFVAILMSIGLSYFQELMPHMAGTATTMFSNATIIGNLVGNISGGFFAQVAGYRNVYLMCLMLGAAALFLFTRTKAQTVNEGVTVAHS
ncbi:MFS transporter [Paenibacillus selenitireducens]|jgi:MFS family permease|uniref:MFS transporter n=2 Tax=Paenibacillus selenitireducens TaxID=1324314 RepID=A0A1T2XLA8_9BACL|nr:MFS transporter [Paenibacillus selenitireducens]